MSDFLDQMRSKMGPLLRRASEMVPGAHDGQWLFEELAGRMIELSSEDTRGSSLTLVTGLVVQAQAARDTVAWVSAAEGTFFPPDAARAGIDLESLVVIRVEGARAAGRVTDKLMRSGGFGLIVLDLGDGIEAARGLSPALQARLQGLAQRNGGLLICLTSKAPSSSSLGPGVSLHAESRRKREQGHFSCSLRALKDRRRPPGWIHREVVRGTPGLR